MEQENKEHYAIITLTKQQLAALPTDKLMSKIDSSVRAGFRRCRTAKDEYDDAKRARAEYEGSDPQEIARLDEAKEKCAVAVKQRIGDIEAYLNEQKELFKSKNLNPDRAYNEAIVPTGEILPNGVERFLIVKRGVTLEECDATDDGMAPSVRASRGYSAMMGMERETKRGKYNDAHLLIEQSAASIDRSEVTPFACACM